MTDLMTQDRTATTAGSEFMNATKSPDATGRNAADRIREIYRAQTRHRRIIDAIDELCAFDDDSLFDVGLDREDLTAEGLEAATDRLRSTYAAIESWDC